MLSMKPTLCLPYSHSSLLDVSLYKCSGSKQYFRCSVVDDKIYY